jgi:hypothetical protein
MKNYSASKHKINQIWNKQQDVDNIKNTKDYSTSQKEKEGLVSNLNFVESDWILCTKTEIYPAPDNCFKFSFTTNLNLNIQEKYLQNIEYALVFKGAVVSYKQLESEEYIIGSYNPNLTFKKLDTNLYQLNILDTGVREGTDDVYVKLLVSIKNLQYKEINKYE